MKKYGTLIGLTGLALVEFIFYLSGGRNNLESFFLIWSIIWLAMIIFGLVNTFQNSSMYNTTRPMGHPDDFFVDLKSEVRTKTSKNSLAMVFILLFLFVLNLLGYFIYM